MSSKDEGMTGASRGNDHLSDMTQNKAIWATLWENGA